MMPLDTFQKKQDAAYETWKNSDMASRKAAFLYGRYDAIREIVENLEDSPGSPGTMQSEMR